MRGNVFPGTVRCSVLKRICLLVVLLFDLQAISEEPEQEGFLLILGGGRTPGEAMEVQQQWKYERRWKSCPVNLTEGYPQIVLSDSISGLNPGFHILIAGACPVSEPDRVRDLELAKAEWPGAYLRRVRWKGPMPCPSSLGKSWSVEKVAETSLSSGRLTAWAYWHKRGEPWTESHPPPWFWRKADGAVIVAQGPGGELLATASIGCEKREGNMVLSFLDRAIAGDNGLVVRYFCAQEVMRDDRSMDLVHDMKMTVTIKGGKLQVRSVKVGEHLERL